MSTKKDSLPVAGVADPGSENGATETAVSDRGYNLPNSRKVYVTGQLHADLRIPFREISLAPTKTMSGEVEMNEPVHVYDTSGPWGDADQNIEVNRRPAGVAREMDSRPRRRGGNRRTHRHAARQWLSFDETRCGCRCETPGCSRGR